MNNRIEILRSICFTKNDIETIKNFGDSFSEKEIEFMVEFKKIYELGLTQLKKFIDKLDEEGSELDTYSIMYYTHLLLNGPLSNYTKEYAEDKKYILVQTPDTLGALGNVTKAPQNITLYPDMGYPLGCSVDVYNKIPQFIQLNLESSIKITEDLFRSGVNSSTVIDNTLPIIDKNPQLRYEEESQGKWVKRSNGTYMVKDKLFYNAVENVSPAIFDKVKERLGEEDFQIYKDKKQYNPFDPEKNESTAINNKIEKEFIEGDKKEIIILDLLGDVFDSEEKRKAVLKISNPEKDEEFILNTNEGQLGA